MEKNYLISKKRAFLAAMLVFLCCFTGVNKAIADHFAAADITIQYKGVVDPCNIKPDYTYEIIMKVYTDCTGILMPLSSSISYESVNEGSGTKNVNLPCVDANGNPVPPNYTGTIISSLCPAFANQSTCYPGGKYYGYKIWEYRGEVKLPSPQTDWKFWYQSCCRNMNVINMPYGQGFYIEAGINNVARYDVSTPAFTTFPLPYICAGRPFKYLNGPIDNDKTNTGQYLRVTNKNPANGGPNPVTLVPYEPGYSLSNPVQSPTGYRVNPISGTAEFLVPNAGVYALAFQLDKYAENDIKNPNDDSRIAYTQRDIQVAVFPCSEPPPSIITQANGAPTNLSGATFKSLTDQDS